MSTIQRADPPTVLAVDDLSEYLELYEQRLDDGYEVRTADSGSAALDALDGVDVVLLDRDMPDLSGDEVLARIHDRDYDPQVAIVSATEPDTDIYDVGYDAYLVKPVDEDELNRTVASLVRRATYFDALDELYDYSRRRATGSAAADDTADVDAEIAALRDTVDDVAAEFDVEDFRASYHRLIDE